RFGALGAVGAVLRLDQGHDLADQAAQQGRFGGGEPGARAAAANRPEWFHRGWLLVLLHRGPQAVAVQDLHVALHGFPGPRGDHLLALVVHVEHQLGRLLLRVAEDVLEYVRDVGHQVHRVVLTIVTQGLSDTGLSADRGTSTSAGAALT